MARYINLDEAIKHLQFDCKAKYPLSYCNGISVAIREIGKLPTADVVPKGEVERLEEELSKANADVKNYMKVAEYQQSLSVKRYHEIKRLKEDIERLEKTLDEYEETSGLKQAKAEVARKIFEEIENSISPMLGLEDDKEYVAILATTFADLKKKYTEAATDGKTH